MKRVLVLVHSACCSWVQSSHHYQNVNEFCYLIIFFGQDLNTSGTADFHRGNTAEIRPVFSLDASEKLIQAVVTSRLDDGNSLIRMSFKAPQNSATHVLTETKGLHFTPALALASRKLTVELHILLLN